MYNICEEMIFDMIKGEYKIRSLPNSLAKNQLRNSLEKIDMPQEQIDWLVPHQANIRIIQSAAKRLSMPMDKVIVNIHKYGNMSAACVPIALAEAAHEKRFKKGDVIALSGFGAGLTWASCILRWSKED